MPNLNDEIGQKSSMRFNNRLLTIVGAILMLSLGAYIVISALKGNPIEGGAWAGMGSFLTGIGVIIGGAFYNQQAQKKSELMYKRDITLGTYRMGSLDSEKK